MKKLFSALSLSMIVLLAAASISYSDTYEIIQITTNDYNDAYPQINAEGDVVWHGQTGSNIYDSLEIFYYDTSEETTSQITDNEYRDLNPQINASGDVVWYGDENVHHNFEIFLYDGSTTTQLTISTEQNNYSPQINASGDVVWYRRPFPFNTNYYQVFLYDRSSGTADMLPSSGYGLSPQINAEGHVVWYNEHDYKDIHLYDGSATILLTSDTTTYIDKSPQINPNGDVVWYGYDYTGSEIFLYDGSTTIQLTDNDYLDTNPQINESGDVVWRGNDGTDYEIYYYDRSSKVTTQLTDNDYDDGYPQINANGEVVWDGYDGTDNEIFLYDGLTTIQLTDNDYDDFSPQINANSEVVWHGGNYDGYYLIGEIFLARRISDNQPPTADAGENITISSEEMISTAIQGSATDEDSDDSLNYRWLAGGTVLHDWTPVGENDECLLYLISTSIGVGTHTLTLEVTDSHATASDDMILIIENSAPHAAPTGDGVYEIFAPVTLGGEVSDFDGDTLTYIWLEESGTLFSESVSTISGGSPVSLPEHILDSLSLGTHMLTLSVSDGINDPAQSNITVEVIDTGAPTLVPVPDKTILWPPNHKMIDITIESNASDNSGDPVTLSAVVASNEPEDGLGDGDQSPDWTEPVIDQDSGLITLQLRAERSGSGDGRIYTITITATDESNNSSQAVVEIIVPHDKGKK